MSWPGKRGEWTRPEVAVKGKEAHCLNCPAIIGIDHRCGTHAGHLLLRTVSNRGWVVLSKTFVGFCLGHTQRCSGVHLSQTYGCSGITPWRYLGDMWFGYGKMSAVLSVWLQELHLFAPASSGCAFCGALNGCFWEATDCGESMCFLLSLHVKIHFSSPHFLYKTMDLCWEARPRDAQDPGAPQ